MTVEGLEITIDKGVQIIALNNPRTKNAFSQEIYEAITDALNSSIENDSVVFTVITGKGVYFSSGTSLALEKVFSDGGIDTYVEKSSKIFRNFVSALIDYPKLLLAVVNGPALGIGVTILGLCDVVFASDKATFQLPFMKLGLCPEACSSYTFPRLMGYAKAGQMIYTGYKMKAEEACQCGLVSNIFEHVKLDKILLDLQKISELPIKSLMCTKLLIRSSDRKHLHEARIAEEVQLSERFRSDDFIAAVLKFSNRHSKL